MTTSEDGTTTRLAAAALLATALAAAAWGASTSVAGSAPRTSLVLEGYEVVTASTRMNSLRTKALSARCSSGKKVLGGGAAILGSSLAALFWNGPAKTRTTGVWTAAARAVTPGWGTWSLEVYAICAYVPSASRE